MNDSDDASQPEPISEVSLYLRELGEGDSTAIDRLLPHIYTELRNLARGIMRRRGRHQTLQPTVLVHEAYVKLLGSEDRNWKNKRHFLSVATLAMRQLLTDYARARDADKRGGDLHRVDLNSGIRADADGDGDEFDVAALDRALTKLQRLHPRQARIVELRYLTGLTLEETAEVLEVSTRTVSLDWNMAQAWLQRELRSDDL